MHAEASNILLKWLRRLNWVNFDTSGSSHTADESRSEDGRRLPAGLHGGRRPDRRFPRLSHGHHRSGSLWYLKLIFKWSSLVLISVLFFYQLRMWQSSGASVERSRTGLLSSPRTKQKLHRKQDILIRRSSPSWCHPEKARSTSEMYTFSYSCISEKFSSVFNVYTVISITHPFRPSGGEGGWVSSSRQQHGQHVQTQALLHQGQQWHCHRWKCLRFEILCLWT